MTLALSEMNELALRRAELCVLQQRSLDDAVTLF